MAAFGGATAAAIFLLSLIILAAASAARAEDVSRNPAPRLTIARTPRRLARGKYLVEGLMHCFRCHSDSDFQHLNGHAPPGKKAGGNVVSPEESPVPPPARLVCPNISPDRATGAGAWRDEDFVRALRQGIGHDGRTLHPMMPYWNFRVLTEEDLNSVIVYVRSIPAVRNRLPKRYLPQEPVLQKTAALATPPAPAGASEQVRHGEYLAHLGNCVGCHNTQTPDRKPVPGMELAGGRVLRGRWGVVAVPNITPDVSGISYYDERRFIAVMRTGHVGARKLSPVMPWADFRNLTDADLKALFAYLRSVPPVQHRLDNTEPATYCPKCRNAHGFGDRN